MVEYSRRLPSNQLAVRALPAVTPQAQAPVAPRMTLTGSAGKSALADVLLRQAQGARAPRTVLEGIGTQLAPSLIGALMKKDVADKRGKFIEGLAGLEGPDLISALIKSGDPAFGTAGINARMAANKTDPMSTSNTAIFATPLGPRRMRISEGVDRGFTEVNKPVNPVAVIDTQIEDNPDTPVNESSVYVSPNRLREDALTTNPRYRPQPKGSLVTVGGSTQETAEAAKVGGYFGKVFTEALEAAGAARKSGVSLNRFEQLQRQLDDAGIDTGKGRKALIKAQSFAQTFFSSILPKDHFEGVGPGEAMEALRNLMALKLRTTEKLPASGFSDADRAFLEAIPPGIEKSKAANTLLTDYLRRVNNRTIQIGRMATRYRKKHGSLDEGFLEEADAFTAANPLFTEKDITSVTKIVAAPPLPDVSVLHGASVEDIKAELARREAAGEL
jgi:hypothetical protein